MIATVIIPTLNRSKYLLKTLESLVKQEFDKTLFEILIIDNNSTDSTSKISHRFIVEHQNISIRYYFEPIPGLLSGRHRGLMESKSEILIFIDDDIITDRFWLSSIVESFNNQSVFIVGGRNLPIFEGEKPEWLKYFWSETLDGKVCSQLSLLDFGTDEKFIDPNFIWGLNFAVRKSTLLELGGFNPDTMPKKLQYLQGDGETGLTIKAKEKNILGFYQPKALVYHIITEERLTINYFLERFYFQGVADSYTYRRKGDIIPKITRNKNILSSMVKYIKLLIRIIIKPYSYKNYILRYKCRKAYEDGFFYHVNTLNNNPRIISWINKNNYFDYNYSDYL